MKLKEYLFELQILDKSNSRLEFYLPYSKEKLFHENDVNCNFYIFGENDLQDIIDKICKKQRENCAENVLQVLKYLYDENAILHKRGILNSKQPKIEEIYER